MIFTIIIIIVITTIPIGLLLILIILFIVSSCVPQLDIEEGETAILSDTKTTLLASPLNDATRPHRGQY